MTGGTTDTRSHFAKLIGEQLRQRGPAMSVSVHPSYSFARMALGDQLHFNLLELLIWTPNVNLDYAVAKTALMLSRVRGDETGVEAGLRGRLWDPLRVKIGAQESLDRFETLQRLGDVLIGGRSALDWLAEPEVALDALTTYFELRAAETGQWIFTRAILKACRGRS